VLQYSKPKETSEGPYVTLKFTTFPRYYLHCSICRKYKEAGIVNFPQHRPHPHCESGKENHCTCDVCF
jgi:hypothetical protein